MRTTVTLDPDVEQTLRRAMRERGVSFKEALNQAIRTGLNGEKRGSEAPFSQPAFHLGKEQNFRWDKALAAADAIEDEELARNLSIRK